jgi:hypothetical protein
MNNYFLILTREHNLFTDRLSTLSDNTTVISDEMISDLETKKQGFIGCTGVIKQPSAWDKSLHFIEQYNLFDHHDYFYFIEDDVYSRNMNTFFTLINLLNNETSDFVSSGINSKEDSRNWWWWKRLSDHVVYFKDPHRSLNPLCRLSSKLVKICLDFKSRYNKLYFHEIMFPSLCAENNMKYLDIRKNSKLNIFFKQFSFRPIIDISTIDTDLIYHPVKPIYKKKYHYY